MNAQAGRVPGKSLPDLEAARVSARTSGLRVLEIRLYALHPGCAEDFHAAVTEQSVPLQENFGIRVLYAGPSAVDESIYVLVRAFAGMAEMDSLLLGFYASDAWRAGPRSRVIACIARDMHAIVPLD